MKLSLIDKNFGVGFAVFSIGCGIGIALLIHKNFRTELIELRFEISNIKNEIITLRREIDQLKKRISKGVESVPNSDDEYFDIEERNIDDFASENETIDFQLLFKKVDSLLTNSEESDRKTVYNLMQKLSLNFTVKNPEYLWRFSRCSYMYSLCFVKIDEEMRKKLLFEGRDLAFAALELEGNNADIYKWCAITSGTVIDFLPIKEKIRQGFKFKELVDRALDLRPNDHILLHMRARWAYSVSQLSWMERKLASVLFTTPPEASIDQALDDFLKAETLNANRWIENLVYVAKCYLIKDDSEYALRYLRTALSGLKITDSGDQTALDEAAYLMSKMSK